MPSFDIGVEFEVFCGKCGSGLCLQSHTRYSRTRSLPQVVVDPCSACLENAADDAAEKAREELRQEIAQEGDGVEIRGLRCAKSLMA